MPGFFSDKLLEEIHSARAKVEKQYRDLVVGYAIPFHQCTCTRICHPRIHTQMTDAIERLDFPEYDKLLNQQMQLGTFAPWMQHSFEEKSKPLAFHPQILSDFLGLAELATNLLQELQKSGAPAKAS